MRAYIQTDKNGDYYNVNAFVAKTGFETIGWETTKFNNIDEILDLDPEILIVGGISSVRKRLIKLGFPLPEKEIDYPEELADFLGRKIWKSSVNALINDKTLNEIFVKPYSETKKFTGKLVRSDMDFIGIAEPNNDIPVWCSEPVEFITEWRCFIRYKEIYDVRRYKGNWNSKFDESIVLKAIESFSQAPNSYAMDIGITKNGQYLLVECNDGHSLGSYGMDSIKYAKFLSARWAQMTSSFDYANF